MSNDLCFFVGDEEYPGYNGVPVWPELARLDFWSLPITEGTQEIKTVLDFPEIPRPNFAQMVLDLTDPAARPNSASYVSPFPTEVYPQQPNGITGGHWRKAA